MEEKDVTVREIKVTDVPMFRELAADPEIRRNTYLQFPAIVDDDTILAYCFATGVRRYVLLVGGQPIGAFSFHKESNGFAAGGIFIKKEFRCLGYGKLAFAARDKQLKHESVKFLRNEIFLDNQSSVQNNLRSGAKEFGWFLKRLNLTEEELMHTKYLSMATKEGRIEICPFCSDDLPFYRELFHESDIQAQTYSECEISTCTDEDAIRFLMANSERRWTAWLHSGSTKLPIGTCHLYDVHRPVANFGMLLEKGFRGRGLGRHLCRLLERAALSDGIKVLRADVFFYSEPALAIMKASGFRQFGFFEKFIA